MPHFCPYDEAVLAQVKWPATQKSVRWGLDCLDRVGHEEHWKHCVGWLLERRFAAKDTLLWVANDSSEQALVVVWTECGLNSRPRDHRRNSPLFIKNWYISVRAPVEYYFFFFLIYRNISCHTAVKFVEGKMSGLSSSVTVIRFKKNITASK